jgi:hypothetical protein
MTARKLGWILISVLALASAAGLAWVAVRRMSRASVAAQSTDPAARKPMTYEVAEVIFDGGFGSGWKDWGWGPHEVRDAGPVRIRFSDFGGIILQHEALEAPFGALVFRFQAPPKWGDFLQVSLKYKQLDEQVLPRVALQSQQIVDVGDGWSEAFVPWRALNPSGKPFDRIVIEARKQVGGDWVPIDHVVLAKGNGTTEAASSLAKEQRFIVDCNKTPIPVSPLIYGIAQASPGLGETAHRVGGNTSTRFNWDLGNVWNTGNDWYFENVSGPKTGLSDWIDDARALGIKMAVTVPMIGWVAKDTVSVGFPVSKFGAQRAQDPGRQAGDGFRPDGTPLTPAPPSTTSVAVTPETVHRWITTLHQRDATRGNRGVWMYILDNEPDLWHVTHRDVHPEPIGYDELLDRTVRYGTAIRQADPEGLLAGPASWGWTGYFYSAKDAVAGLPEHADRRAHGDVPLLAWYLRSLAEHEKKTGVRLLDVLDVHFYPQVDGVYKNARTDAEAAAARIRSTRALWDVNYRDESWIEKPIYLLPRLKELIAQNYPDRGISIGEWSFGAEDHISGGLAIAEALGRFGQFGITSAFYWFEIKQGTPAYQAFRAFRNFDGKGGRFLDLSIPTQGPPGGGVSLFASRDAAGSRIVAVALNLDPANRVDAELDLASCGGVASHRVYSYVAGAPGLTENGAARGASHAAGATSTRVVLAPYSINVIDITPRDAPKR